MDIVKNQTQTVQSEEVQSTPTSRVHTHSSAVVDHVDPTEFSLYKTNQVVWYIISLICLLIGARFLLLLFGANRVGIADFIYSLSGLFVAPFSGLFESPVYGDKFFDTAGLVALIAYPILGYIINSLLALMSKNS